MTARPLHLRRVTGAHARVARRLALRPWMTLTVQQRSGRLLLGACQRNAADDTLHWFDCALGPLGLSNAQAMLDTLSSCPTFIACYQADNWTWPLYNAGLASELAGVLGDLRPIGRPEPPLNQWAYCAMTLELADGRLDGVLALPADALAHWLEQRQWNIPAHQPRTDLPLAFALRLGRLSLPRRILGSLRPGDVLCPPQTDFDTSGAGWLGLANRRVQVQVQVRDQAKALQLEVVEIEERLVTDHDEFHEPHANAWNEDPDAEALPDVAYDEQHDTPYRGESHAASDPSGATSGVFSELTIPLTLRCGQLHLSLAELATLAPGMILEVPGVTPGLAGLFYGERRLAQGELVEVEGRLGLQITQVDDRG